MTEQSVPEQRIKVDVETGQAKADLRRLHAKKGRVKDRSQSSLAGRMRTMALPIVGAVGGFSFVSRMARKARGTSGVDPWTAALTPIQAALRQHLDESLGYSARARKRARAHVASELGASAFYLKTAAFTQEYYDVMERRFTAEEEGRNFARQNLRGPTLEDLLKQAGKGYVDIVRQAWGYAYDKLTE